jgi:hypothetical protein
MKILDQIDEQKQTAFTVAKAKSAYKLRPTNSSKDIFVRGNFVKVSYPTRVQDVYMNGSMQDFFRSPGKKTLLNAKAYDAYDIGRKMSLNLKTASQFAKEVLP